MATRLVPPNLQLRSRCERWRRRLRRVLNAGRDELDVWRVMAMAGLLGLLLGLRYKVASLIAASGAAVLLTCAFAVRHGWSFEFSALTILASLLAMQGAYVVGLILSTRVRNRRRPPPRSD